MRNKFTAVVSVIFSFFRLFFKKIFLGKKLKFNLIERISPMVRLSFYKNSQVELGNKIRIHSGSRIVVTKNASLKIGDNVSLGYDCFLVCRNKITIESGAQFGPGVKLYDHDHDFRHPDGIKSGHFKNGTITIGENSWIGCNTVILRDTHIGKNCVIAAGSVVKGTVPDNTVYIQKKDIDLIDIVN